MNLQGGYVPCVITGLPSGTTGTPAPGTTAATTSDPMQTSEAPVPSPIPVVTTEYPPHLSDIACSMVGEIPSSVYFPTIVEFPELKCKEQPLCNQNGVIVVGALIVRVILLNKTLTRV